MILWIAVGLHVISTPMIFSICESGAPDFRSPAMSFALCRVMWLFWASCVGSASCKYSCLRQVIYDADPAEFDSVSIDVPF